MSYSRFILSFDSSHISILVHPAAAISWGRLLPSSRIRNRRYYPRCWSSRLSLDTYTKLLKYAIYCDLANKPRKYTSASMRILTFIEED